MAATGGARRRATLAAGVLAWAFGAVHVVVATAERRTEWSGVAAEGWWNTATLAEPSTPEQARRALLFWRTAGSFGAPMLALGTHVLWSTRRGHGVPRAVGWTLLAWGVPFVILLPASPGWVVPVVGGLLVAGQGAAGDREPSAP